MPHESEAFFYLRPEKKSKENAKLIESCKSNRSEYQKYGCK